MTNTVNPLPSQLVPYSQLVLHVTWEWLLKPQLTNNIIVFPYPLVNCSPKFKPPKVDLWDVCPLTQGPGFETFDQNDNLNWPILWSFWSLSALLTPPPLFSRVLSLGSNDQRTLCFVTPEVLLSPATWNTGHVLFCTTVLLNLAKDISWGPQRLKI